MKPARSSWFLVPRPEAAARLRLFCLPFAGAGAAALHPLAVNLPAGIEAWVVRLPGRESRLAETPFRESGPLIEALTAEVAPHLDRPYALFGYSLGGLLAFELARALRARAAPLPARLFAAARRPPHLPCNDSPLHSLPDAAFVAAVQERFGGIPPAIRDNAELMALFVPALRADLAVSETHAFRPGEPLACPISVFGGQDDRHMQAADLAGWQDHTTQPLRVRVLPGDHFFLQPSREALCRAIAEDLELD